MTDTFGPLFDGWSKSADLQLFLANRLPAKLAGLGSPLYALTWKRLAMPLGDAIFQLQASELRIGANAYGGWPTVQGAHAYGSPKRSVNHNGRLEDVAAGLKGWPTPTVVMGRRKPKEYLAAMQAEKDGTGPHPTLSIEQAAQLAAWETPIASDGKHSRKMSGKGKLSNRGVIVETIQAKGWHTPLAADGTAGRSRNTRDELLNKGLIRETIRLRGWQTVVAQDSHGREYTTDKGKRKLTNQGLVKQQIKAHGWPTVTARDGKDGIFNPDLQTPVNSFLGRTVCLSILQTEQPAPLNPDFCRWLMGYPIAWASFEGTETP